MAGTTAYSLAMRALHVVAIALPFAACGPSQRDDDATPTGDAAVTVTDAGKCEEVIDLVFVLDTSSSMDFVLTKLQQQIAQVVDASNMLAADAHFGLIVFQDNHFLDNTGPLANGVVHTSAASLQSAFAYYRDNYTAYNRNPGDGLSGPTTQNRSARRTPSTRCTPRRRTFRGVTTRRAS